MPRNLCRSNDRLALRAQLLQAAHFIFHRIKSLKRYPGRLESVIVK